jgi:hypothetical protein
VQQALSVGAPMLTSPTSILRHHQRQRQIPPAPAAAPRMAPSKLGGPPWGTCWEAGGLTPRAEHRGRSPPFATIVVADLGLLALSGKVEEAVAAQATPWQPASRYSVQVGQTVETSVMKLCRDPPGLREQL